MAAGRGLPAHLAPDPLMDGLPVLLYGAFFAAAVGLCCSVMLLVKRRWPGSPPRTRARPLLVSVAIMGAGLAASMP